jgi:hypothetical protein
VNEIINSCHTKTAGPTVAAQPRLSFAEMEDVLQKLRAARGNFEATRQNVQTNGTPIRSYARIARESVQSSYGVVISSISSVESKIDDVTEKIDRFRQSNAAMVSYCQLHPSTAIFGSAGAVAIPSYFGKSPHLTAPHLSVSHALVVFGVRGMTIGALGAASFSTLFVGALLYTQRKQSDRPT